MTNIEIRSIALSPADAEVAALVLHRAFWDDPMIVYILPDEAHRAAAGPAFFTVAVNLGLNDGDAWTTPGTPLGAAIWLPPSKVHISDEMIANAGLEQLAAAFGDEAMERFGRLLGDVDAQHQAIMGDRAHWYLLGLGVEPERQGQGIGGTLIAPALARADELGFPCYLETMKAKNLPFYKRHGFEVATEIEVDGLPVWCMRREPAR
jgi:GNAT superfamily N-acetyltransferase